MKHSIAIAGFILAFAMTGLSVGAVGWFVSIFVSIHFEKTDVLGTVPSIYWPIVWTVAGLVAIIVGIHSFRATLRRCQK